MVDMKVLCLEDCFAVHPKEWMRFLWLRKLRILKQE
jgi:hypothetical protein